MNNFIDSIIFLYINFLYYDLKFWKIFFDLNRFHDVQYRTFITLHEIVIYKLHILNYYQTINLFRLGFLGFAGIGSGTC